MSFRYATLICLKGNTRQLKQRAQVWVAKKDYQSKLRALHFPHSLHLASIEWLQTPAKKKLHDTI